MSRTYREYYEGQIEESDKVYRHHDGKVRAADGVMEKTEFERKEKVEERRHARHTSTAIEDEIKSEE